MHNNWYISAYRQLRLNRSIESPKFHPKKARIYIDALVHLPFFCTTNEKLKKKKKTQNKIRIFSIHVKFFFFIVCIVV